MSTPNPGEGQPQGGQPPLPPEPGAPQPEYLSFGEGQPLLPATKPAGGRGRRIGLIGGAVVGLGALAAAGTWAFVALSGGGAQPAAVLPSSAVAYASIDLDPSAGQKIEALKTLKKFPALDDALNLDADDDLRRAFFDRMQDEGACDNLDYDKDIEPWLGDRAAVAVVDDSGDPAPVLVVQVSDEKAAEEGLTSIAHCAASGNADDAGDVAAEVGWKISDGWAIIAESDETAADVVADAAKASLVDDETYANWVDRLGNPGVVNLYLAPSAGKMLADHLDDLTGLGSGLSPMDLGVESSGNEPAAYHTDSATDDELGEARAMLKDFAGMAATVRFKDGGLEFEAVSDAKQTDGIYGTDGVDVISTLPEDTAAAVGMRFADGWVGTLLDQVKTTEPGVDDMISEIESGWGLQIPEDIETLFGDSAVLALGSDFDVNTLQQSTDGSGVPIGIKIHGDTDGIESVLDKLRGNLPPDMPVLDSEVSGDMVAVGPDDDYRSELVGDGGLGKSATFRDVVPQAEDAVAVFYVNFDANDWLTNLAESDAEAQENLEPLAGLGLSSWVDGDTTHALFRLTTN
ncbi:MAG: DUF3352 domain-containing protein [Nocardioides sp.]|uniref:DUF3352 domain-containing protein n=1 Tax=Nocardioides sp. TaxID=35761 RepID=UPI0039E2CA13